MVKADEDLYEGDHGSFQYTVLLSAQRDWGKPRKSETSRQSFGYSSRKYMLGVKTTVPCDTAPCRLVDIDRRFRGVYCLHHKGPLWRRRQYVSPKHWYLRTSLHGITTQNNNVVFL